MSSFSVKKFEPVTIRGFWAEGGVIGAPDALSRIEQAAAGSSEHAFGLFWDADTTTDGPHKGQYFAGANLPDLRGDDVDQLDVPGGPHVHTSSFSYAGIPAAELGRKIQETASGLAAFSIHYYPRDQERPEVEDYDRMAERLVLRLPVVY